MRIIEVHCSGTMAALLIAVLLASVPSALSVSEPTDRDILRGKTMVPRASYRGADFRSMGQVRNGHLQREAGHITKDCSERVRGRSNLDPIIS